MRHASSCLAVLSHRRVVLVGDCLGAGAVGEALLYDLVAGAAMGQGTHAAEPVQVHVAGHARGPCLAHAQSDPDARWQATKSSPASSASSTYCATDPPARLKISAIANARIAATANTPPKRMMVPFCESGCLRRDTFQVEDHVDWCAGQRRRPGHADDDVGVTRGLIDNTVRVDYAEVGGDVAD